MSFTDQQIAAFAIRYKGPQLTPANVGDITLRFNFERIVGYHKDESGDVIMVLEGGNTRADSIKKHIEMMTNELEEDGITIIAGDVGVITPMGSDWRSTDLAQMIYSKRDEVTFFEWVDLILPPETKERAEKQLDEIADIKKEMEQFEKDFWALNLDEKSKSTKKGLKGKTNNKTNTPMMMKVCGLSFKFAHEYT
jgi:hypothetical protein